MLSSTAMSKQSDGVSPLPFLARFGHNPLVFFCIFSLFIDQVLRELVSTREASMGVRKLCVRGGLSYISMGGQYQDYTDTS